MKVRKTIQHKARIELIPMLDTIFLLLVFFIYAMLSLTVHRGIDVDLPSADSGIVNTKDYISVSFNSNGEFFLDKTNMSLDNVVMDLSEKKKENPRLKVIINGDRSAQYGNSIKLLDALRAAGIKEVFFGTEPEY